MKSPIAVAGTLLLLGLAVGANVLLQVDGPPPVGEFAPGGFWASSTNARQLTSMNWSAVAFWSELDSKETDAIYGDLVLSNPQLKVVVAQPIASRHANMTVRDVAGAIIDLQATSGGGDQLAAFYPGKKKFAYRSVSFLDHAGKEESPTSKGIAGTECAIVVKADATEQLPEAVVKYSLRGDDPFITITSTYTNRGQTALTVPLEDDLRADGGKEEMFRSPNATTDRFWLYDRFWEQAYGLDAHGRKMQLTSDSRTTAIKYETADGQTQVKLEPGETFEFSRRLYPAQSVFHVHSLSRKLLSPKAPQPNDADAIQRFVMSSTAGDNRDYVIDFKKGDASIGSIRPWRDYDSLPLAPDSDTGNILGLPFENGEYSASISYCGQSCGPAQKFTVTSERNPITLNMACATGHISGSITDVKGDPIPCKVQLTPLSDGLKLDFGPETGERAIRNLIYSPDGYIFKSVPAGKYAVTISHGAEYDAVFKEVDLTDGTSVDLSHALIRTVDTTGWVSSDFHSHSSPSGDNTGSQLGRVINLVCENIEFAPCTEHNRVSTYQPHIDQLGIGQFISSVSGIELTGSPLPLNHQNAFPIQMKPRTQDGGGPVAGPDLEAQIERLALWNDRSEKLLQVNHPDPGWMFYDKNGDGKPDGGHERAFPFMDVMEVHAIDNALNLTPVGTREGLPFHNRVFNWLQLLNQGFRIYGVVNTDSHYNFHGSGWLRNWIQSSTDDPAKIDHMEMVHASEQGRIIMSNGPYLEVSAHESGKTESVVSGQDLKANSGRVTLKVRVQCANWLDIDTLFVLVNGRKHAIHNYTREQNPDLFRGGVVKFEKSLELELKSDAHVIVVAGDVGGNLFKVYGDSATKAQPTAISNPIFFDVDGNGFVPNKDTLDHPLPVKHPNSK